MRTEGADRIAPGELPGPISVIPTPENPLPVGINKKVGRIGGYVRYEDRDLAPGEALWRLVIGKEEVEGRFATEDASSLRNIAMQ